MSVGARGALPVAVLGAAAVLLFTLAAVKIKSDASGRLRWVRIETD